MVAIKPIPPQMHLEQPDLINACYMGSRTQPGSIPCEADQTCPDRIQSCIAQGFPEVLLIERTGVESVLPEMLGQDSLNLQQAYAIGMEPAKPFSQRICRRQFKDGVDMIEH
jgi:hypothetical protein